MTIEQTLRGMGVKWLRVVHSYSVAKMAATLKEAMRTAERGLKVIIADAECMLARQRRLRAENAEKLRRGERLLRTRFGVDDEICTGDHSCIRLSGCPSLTIKPSPDPLRTDPVAAVIESCVGCGLCGEVAHAAVLCPSFYRADIVRNPNWWDRTVFGFRQRMLRLLGSDVAASSPPPLRARSAGEAGREGGKPQTHQSLSTPLPNLPPQGGRGQAAASGEAVPFTAAQSAKPTTLLIAALGGEGGGVLTNWIVAAAASQGLPVQSTSIPGVAQRTGATTYYVEIVPTPWSALGDRRPVLALQPGPGDVDLVVASELMEAGRTIAGGFVTRDRTTMIASTTRNYLTVEKMAMGDGRYDPDRLAKAVTAHAQSALLLDMEALAQQSGAIVNSVMLGLIAGSGRLPIPVEAFEHAIRGEGKAAESNLRGFRAGLAAALDASAAPQAKAPGKRWHDADATLADLERHAATMPPVARDIVIEGARRLVPYQNLAYAQLYLDRLAPIVTADTRANAGGRLLREVARHLAVRMSYEDVIRVAQAKIDPARLARVRTEVGVGTGEPYTITEFLKPGIEEMCSVLPPGLARKILGVAERRGWLERAYFGMAVNTTSVTGYLRFAVLAKLRRWRPKTYRYRQEQAAIESWLALIDEASKKSAELALEVAECARLIKGYGDTHKRGTVNFRAIETRVIRPALAGEIPLPQAADAIASARTAALLDPDGEGLAHCLADIERHVAMRIAAE
jgi:indolepyruvate ferredoxin oxidoreductase beta subunit